MLCFEVCPATDVHSVLRCVHATKLPEDGVRTEICRSVFNVLMCKFYKFYICAVVGIIIE